jgi:hypothetical protein
MQAHTHTYTHTEVEAVLCIGELCASMAAHDPATKKKHASPKEVFKLDSATFRRSSGPWPRRFVEAPRKVVVAFNVRVLYRTGKEVSKKVRKHITCMCRPISSHQRLAHFEKGTVGKNKITRG